MKLAWHKMNKSVDCEAPKTKQQQKPQVSTDRVYCCRRVAYPQPPVLGERGEIK